MGVNPHCRRLGCWPDELLTLVQARGFDTLGWDAVLFKLKDLPLTKYCDFNLVNLLNKSPDKFTIEFRIMPSTLDADRIEDWAKLFRKILHQAVSLDEDLALVDGLDSWLTAKNWDPK